jgi:hypothetical protein
MAMYSKPSNKLKVDPAITKIERETKAAFEKLPLVERIGKRFEAMDSLKIANERLF